MKSFSTYNGDVVIGKTIEMVDGSELLRQKVERVIATNKGEWSFDEEEGIDFRALLCKNPDEDEVRESFAEALAHIDETLSLMSFEMIARGRTAVIRFKAINGDGDEVGGEYTIGG